MRAIADLQAERRQLAEQLAELDAKIAAHPDTMRGHFEDRNDLRELVDSLLYVEKVSGWTDSRKNPVQWSGWRYSFRDAPGEVFWARSGSNWCHSFRDCGVDGDERAPDVDEPYDVWEEAGESDDGYYADILQRPRHLAVAYALWIREGW